MDSLGPSALLQSHHLDSVSLAPNTEEQDFSQDHSPRLPHPAVFSYPFERQGLTL